MIFGNFSHRATGCVLAALLSGVCAWAQAELYDRVTVDFANNVNVNGKVLPPGHYEIRQLRSTGGGSRILFVASDNGTEFETSGATIPIVSNETPGETKVILQHVGQNYYLNKIWIGGKNYGYEFPLPAEAKNLINERSEPVTLTATYNAPQPEQVAQAAPPPPPPPAAAPPPPPPQPTQPQTPPEPEAKPQPETAPPTPEPQAEPAPPPQPAPAPTMPATADNWATLVLVGGALSGLGLLLRRK